MREVNHLFLAAAIAGLCGAVAPQNAEAGDYYRTYTYTRTVTTPSAMPTTTRIIESPVMVERVVQQPVMVERVCEKPVVIERTIEKPVTVERTIERPVVIHEHGRDHLIDLGVFDLFKLGLL